MFQFNAQDSIDYTLKGYYFNSAHYEDDKEVQEISASGKKTKRCANSSIDQFFEKPKKQKKTILRSSSSQSGNGGTSYISMPASQNASHLIKIEVYDVNKLKDIPKEEHWKHVDVRVKYYAQSENDKNLKNSRDIIYNITKQISENIDCKKYFFDHQK